MQQIPFCNHWIYEWNFLFSFIISFLIFLLLQFFLYIFRPKQIILEKEENFVKAHPTSPKYI